MRNFSATVANAFVTYNVNRSEYVSDVGEVEHKVAFALVRALEISKSAYDRIREGFVRSGFDTNTYYDQEVETSVTPSEISVVLEFLVFSFSVHRCIDRDSLDGERTRAFVYHNLNTGASVLWTHVVI